MFMVIIATASYLYMQTMISEPGEKYTGPWIDLVDDTCSENGRQVTCMCEEGIDNAKEIGESG